MCQRATGGAFAALADIPMEDFAWTSGTPRAFRSSSLAERHFCGDCGTPLSYHQIDGPNMEILLGTFDNPSCLEPTYAIAIESKLPWLERLHVLPGKTLADYIGKPNGPDLTNYQSEEP